jgi:mannose-6-phosphate isomerase-like protein (cupin superfamily)
VTHTPAADAAAFPLRHPENEMNDTPVAAPTEPKTSIDLSRMAKSLMTSFASEAVYVPGRRSFFTYRDLGLKAATEGRARANLVTSVAGMLEETGWHYHECDFQFVYWMQGIAVLEFEDGTVCTFGAGDAALIPGGMRHNEIYLSEDKVSIEFSMPGEIGTVMVDRPAGLPEVLEPRGRRR